MQTAEKKQADWAVLWQEERQTLSLQGEPVLEYALVRPQIRDGGRGGRRLDRYYQHLAEVWRRRWSRALYWHACLDLARCREQSRPFHPWQAHLEGRVLFQDQDSLSIRLDAEEVHGRRPPAPGTDGGCLVPAGGSPAAGRSLLPRRPAVVAPPDPEAAGTG